MILNQLVFWQFGEECLGGLREAFNCCRFWEYLGLQQIILDGYLPYLLFISLIRLTFITQ